MARNGTSIRVWIFALLVAVCLGSGAHAAEVSSARGEFVAIVYRDISDREPDQRFGALTTAKLAEQFDWLKAHGYQPVSLDDLMGAARGGTLPPKPVVLTFDDGFESFYTRVFPLLEAFHYPAIIGLAGPWMSAAPGTMVRYGDIEVPRANFMSWDQVREIVRSGLVEIAAQPGERSPDIVVDTAYLQKLRQDLTTLAGLVRQETGRTMRAMAWPHRDRSPQMLSLLASLGFPTILTVEPGRGGVAQLARIPRQPVIGDPGTAEFIDQVLRVRPGAISSEEGRGVGGPPPGLAR